MQVLTKDELFSRKHFFLRKLKESVFVYPTDTIYGVGCNALDSRLVSKVRELKGRHAMPFSVIAPSKEWIRDVCEIDEKGEEWLAKLPGPYTLIFRMRKPEEMPHNVTLGGETLGVRIPDHWIGDLARELKVPLITTSANQTGANYMRTIDDLSSSFRQEVAFVIYEGEIAGHPSTLVHLYAEEVKVQKR